jgi:hypothetical protein
MEAAVSQISPTKGANIRGPNFSVELSKPPSLEGVRYVATTLILFSAVYLACRKRIIGDQPHGGCCAYRTEKCIQ